VAAGSGFVTTMRIRIQESQTNANPCRSGSETAGSVKAVIKKVEFFKTIYYLYDTYIERHLIYRNCLELGQKTPLLNVIPAGGEIL
jgi:hypothetical protein